MVDQMFNFFDFPVVKKPDVSFVEIVSSRAGQQASRLVFATPFGTVPMELNPRPAATATRRSLHGVGPLACPKKVTESS